MYRRLQKGAPIRAAMEAVGLDIKQLAAKTRAIDPDGRGLSKSYVGCIVGAGKTARAECSDRAANLISDALEMELSTGFEAVSYVFNESTSTRGSQIEAVQPLPRELMVQDELSRFLRKSSSWIDQQIQNDPHWPGLIYVGRSRRFNPYAVVEAQLQRTSA